MPSSPTRQFHKEVFSAYAATGSRLVAWVIVTALVFRRLGAANFAMLALVRTTIALLNNTTLGLAPAMVRLMAVEDKSPRKTVGPMLDLPGEGPSAVFSSAMGLSVVVFTAGALLATLYGLGFYAIHDVPEAVRGEPLRDFALAMALGAVCRLNSEPTGAVLQVRGHISTDNFLLAGSEWIWALLCAAALFIFKDGLLSIGVCWLISGALLAAARLAVAFGIMGFSAFSIESIRPVIIRQLLVFGFLVAAAQSADFLYAPTDNILINRLIDPRTVAVYAPAIQIDAALLLLVSGLSQVILPRAAIAHAAGQREQLRHYYLAGTGLSIGLLAVASLLVYWQSPRIFSIWLHDPMPETVAILPFILCHTLIGGSSAVGRSVLLATGKVGAFTLAVLCAGVLNVVLSFCFVRFAHLGLRGIVLGTIAAVVARCALWMPWYVWKTLRDDAQKPDPIMAAPV